MAVLVLCVSVLKQGSLRSCFVRIDRHMVWFYIIFNGVMLFLTCTGLRMAVNYVVIEEGHVYLWLRGVAETTISLSPWRLHDWHLCLIRYCMFLVILQVCQ